MLDVIRQANRWVKCQPQSDGEQDERSLSQEGDQSQSCLPCQLLSDLINAIKGKVKGQNKIDPVIPGPRLIYVRPVTQQEPREMVQMEGEKTKRWRNKVKPAEGSSDNKAGRQVASKGARILGRWTEFDLEIFKQQWLRYPPWYSGSSLSPDVWYMI
ncbi:uncharacterized protein LOC144601994 [Rhinoraja longicauda]